MMELSSNTTGESVTIDHLDAPHASDLLERFQEMHRASVTSQYEDNDCDDDEEMDSIIFADYISLRAFWEFCSTAFPTFAVSDYAAAALCCMTAGWVWHIVPVILTFVALPLRWIEDLNLFLRHRLKVSLNSWPPPALILLAVLTIVALIVHPDGFTWVLVHRLRDRAVDMLQNTVTICSLLINDCGAVLSTILAALVFYGVFFFIYVLHKTLSPRPKLHLQWHSLDSHRNKKKKKRGNAKGCSSRHKNRFQPRSDKTSVSLNVSEAEATDYPQHHDEQAEDSSVYMSLEERELPTNPVLPVLSENTPVYPPLMLSSRPTDSNSDQFQREDLVTLRSPALGSEPAATFTSAFADNVRSSHLRTASASSDASTASASESTLSSRSDDTTLAQMQSKKKANRMDRTRFIGDAVSTESNTLSTRTRGKQPTSISTCYDMTSVKSARSTHYNKGLHQNKQMNRGSNGPTPKVLSRQSKTSSGCRNHSQLHRPKSHPSPKLSVAPIHSHSAGDMAPVTTSIFPSRACYVPRSLQTPDRTSGLSGQPLQPSSIPGSASNFNSSGAMSPYTSSGRQADSSVWASNTEIVRSQNRQHIPPPPGISITTGAKDTLGIPKFDQPPRMPDTPSWTYGVPDASAGAHRTLEVPPSPLYKRRLDPHHKSVRNNPFVPEDEDEIEAELQALGGRMVGCVLDF